MKTKVLYFVFGFCMAFSLTVAAAQTGFSDVPASAYFAEPVRILSEMGIIKGYSDGSFKPANSVNRADVATMLARFTESVDLDLSISNVTYQIKKENSVPAYYTMEVIFHTSKRAQGLVQAGSNSAAEDVFTKEHKIELDLGTVKEEEKPKVFTIDISAVDENGKTAAETRQYLVN